MSYATARRHLETRSGPGLLSFKSGPGIPLRELQVTDEEHNASLAEAIKQERIACAAVAHEIGMKALTSIGKTIAWLIEKNIEARGK